jgi:hypothetical protein
MEWVNHHVEIITMIVIAHYRTTNRKVYADSTSKLVMALMADTDMIWFK